jgi:hypothetical protein
MFLADGRHETAKSTSEYHARRLALLPALLAASCQPILKYPDPAGGGHRHDCGNGFLA